jgi:serine/threonine protein kinase/heme-degrading monooxygenase HmoA
MSAPDHESTPVEFREGFVFAGRFVLGKELGHGGMGSVWLARDARLGREVALKFVLQRTAAGVDLPPSEEDREALRREVRRCIEMHHTHIVRMHDFIEHASPRGIYPAICMEYVPGRSLTKLREMQPGRRFAWTPQFATWVRQTCEALHYAHTASERPVVHRDLKPDNLMVTERGAVRVVDFGLAATLADSQSMARTESGGGTPGYMSPQQLQGHRATPLDDVYGLGATLYSLLTGKPPYFRGGLGAIHAQVLDPHLAPPSLAERCADLDEDLPAAAPRGATSFPAAVEEAIAACLAKDPARRPPSIAALAQQLGLPGDWPVESEPLPPESVSPPEIIRVGPRPGVPPGALPRVGGWDEAAPPRARAAARSRGAPACDLRRARRAAAFPRAVGVGRAGRGGARGRWHILLSRRAGGTADSHSSTDADRHATPVPTPAPTPMPATPVPTPAPITPATATKDAPFVNSLGMKFVPVPGTGVLFSVWETRVKDFAAFIADSGHDMSKGEKAYTMESDGVGGFEWRQVGGDWRNPRFPQPQGEDHPVVCVSWEDAEAFCAWLSKKEGREYRLPTDAEWSTAVGLPRETGTTPEDKDMKNTTHFPWGGTFPPTTPVGNYADATAKKANPSWTIIDGYDDGFAWTSPVGRFAGNQFGLHDLGGNVWEWCEDWWKPGATSRVLRGGSFRSGERDRLLSSYRSGIGPGVRFGLNGFRVVVVGSSAGR